MIPRGASSCNKKGSDRHRREGDGLHQHKVHNCNVQCQNWVQGAALSVQCLKKKKKLFCLCAVFDKKANEYLLLLNQKER